MSRRMIKILVVGALLVSAFVSASSASATSWSTNGSLTYTATAPTAKSEIHSPSLPLTICTNVSATAHLNAGGGSGSTFDTGTVTPRLTGCTLAGLVATVNCVANSAHLVAASELGTLVQGHLTNISCTVTRGACTYTISGEITAQYNDTSGQLTLFAAGQALTVVAPAACNAITGFTSASGGVAPATVGSNATPIGNLTFTVTSTPRPDVHHIP